MSFNSHLWSLMSGSNSMSEKNRCQRWTSLSTGVLLLRGKCNFRLTNGLVQLLQWCGCSQSPVVTRGKVLNIWVNLCCDPHLQSDVGRGCKAQMAEMSFILKRRVGLSLRTRSEIQEALERPMLLGVEKSYWKHISHLLRVPRKATLKETLWILWPPSSLR